MRNDYKILMETVKEVTGFELPLLAPPTGQQFIFERPNKQAYAVNNKIATGVYFGGGRLYVRAPSALHETLAEGETEEYMFSVDRATEYGRYREEATARREREMLALAEVAYFSGSVLEDEHHPALKGLQGVTLADISPGSAFVCHADYAPKGVTLGEVRAIPTEPIQAFWPLDQRTKNQRTGHWDVCAYRTFSNGHHSEFCRGETSCAHIHRFIPLETPIVWGCGLQNIAMLKKRFPDFSIFEAYKLEQIPSLMDSVSNWGNQYGRVPQFIGLTSGQMQSWESLIEKQINEAGTIKNVLHNYSNAFGTRESVVFELSGVTNGEK